MLQLQGFAFRSSLEQGVLAVDSSFGSSVLVHLKVGYVDDMSPGREKMLSWRQKFQGETYNEDQEICSICIPGSAGASAISLTPENINFYSNLDGKL